AARAQGASMSNEIPDREGPTDRYWLRWADRPRPPAGAEEPADRAAALLLKLRDPAPLDGPALARIAVRLAEEERRPRARAPRWLWLPALGGAAALLAIGLRLTAPAPSAP